MKPLIAPEADDKIGLKIDYLARRLALVLAPSGCRRQGRMLVAQAGEGPEQHWRIVHLQGDQWNEGSRGEFFVNLVVQFPALMRLRARQPGCDWMLQYVGKPDFAAGQVKERLESLLAGLPEGNPHAALRLKIRRDTDLAQLADALDAAVLDIGWPWLLEHASLQAVAGFEGSRITCEILDRIAAAVLLGDLAGAQRIVADKKEFFAGATPAGLKALREWLAGLGLDVAVLSGKPAPRPPSRFEDRRREGARAEKAANEETAAAARARLDDSTPDPAILAEAWIAERRARWRDDPKPLTDLPTGVRIAGLSEPVREAVLLALLQVLLAAEEKACRDPMRPRAGEFALDEQVRPLVAALLPTLATPQQDTLEATLVAMDRLSGRVAQDLVTGRFPWPFAALVKWLEQRGAGHRARLKPLVKSWLDGFSARVVQRHEQMTAAIAAELARPLDPDDPMAEIFLEARERQAEILASLPPPDPAEVLRRLGDYPEQCLASEDRQAVRCLRRFLLRDDADGRLPVAFDADDWGAAAQRAWDGAPAGLRAALTPVLQDWLEGVDTKPTQRWLRALDGRIAALEPALAADWRGWVADRLRAFADCSGRTEWATTGARPGVGARLGEASEAILLGLLWWSWRDPAFAADGLAACLRIVNEAAWQRLPEVGARSPTVGGLALRMQAGLGGDCRAEVVARAAQKKAKQMKQAAERALADPLPRPAN